MRGLIGNPPSPAAPQLRMTSSDSSMAHFSYGKRAPRPCEHISVFCRFSKEGSKKGHLAPIVAHSAYSRRFFGIVHTVWDAGVRISTALDIRRGSGPTAHSIACLREGSIIQRFMVFYIVRLAVAVPHGPRHSARFRRCMGWLRNRIRRRGGQTVPGRGGGGGGGVKIGYGQAGQGYFGYTL